MKIVHICMVAYIDGWGYQENLLPEYMSRNGNDVVVVGSSNKFPSYLKSEDVESIKNKGSEYFINGVHVYRIPVYLSTSIYSFFCVGLKEILRKEKPDVIFHHGVNSSTMMVSWLYALSKKNVCFFVDNHADKINESKRKYWNFLTTKIIMQSCIRLINKRVDKYYGVTPGRCDYLVDVYGANKKKVKLLPIGCDTDSINNIGLSKNEIRGKYLIDTTKIIIVSGGKMGVDKGTLSLLNAYNVIRKRNFNVELLLFGRFTDIDTEKLAHNTEGVHVFGWCNRTTTLELLLLSDIACWPIHHTTLIEDAIGCELPLVVRKTFNTSHSVNGNGEYVEYGTEVELINSLSKILNDIDSYKKNATIMRDTLSYNNLAKQVELDTKDK